MQFQFHQAQEQLASDLSRYIVVNAGRRFGKTLWVAYEMFGVACAKPNNDVWYFGPTFDDARRILWDTLKGITEAAWAEKPNESRLELILKTAQGGTSKISLFGWDRANNRRGSGLALAAFDEVAFMRDFSHYWTTVFQPALLDKKGRAIFTSTPNGYNDFYDLYEYGKVTEGWKSYHFTSYDNPFLDAGEIDSLKLQYISQGKENSFFQEYMGEFRKMEGLVYKDFDTTWQVKNITYDPSRYRSVLMGLDWGFVDPTCAVFVGVLPDGRLEVFDEYKAYETTKDDTITQLNTKNAIYGVRQSYPDCADQDGFAMLRKSGFNPQECDKSSGSVERGIDSVRSLFRKNSIAVSSSCVHLIKALSIYHYKQTGNKTEPDHEESDMCDALRYLVHTYSPAVNDVRKITVAMDMISEKKMLLRQQRQNGMIGTQSLNPNA